MNIEEQKITGINEIHLLDSLNAPLLNFNLHLNEDTLEPSINDLIIYVDRQAQSNISEYKREFLFELLKPLKYFNGVSDKFIVQIVIKNNDIYMEASVLRLIGENENGLYLLDSEETEIIECLPITLFEGENYIYTNYSNANLFLTYPKNNEVNKLFLNSALFHVHKLRNDGEFSLDDIYFKDAFTMTENKLNLEVDNANICCLTSKNNKFSLDEDGNLIVNSISFNTVSENLNGICGLIYPIGSIYTSINDTNPSLLFGGTWEQIEDKFLLGASNNYQAGSTGGEINHTLTIEEMPKHAHGIPQSHPWNSTSSNGYHLHRVQNNYIVESNVSTSSVGGNVSHNNMPPFLAVYIWKRIG